MEATHEQVDRNDLLASTRAVFVRAFVDGLEICIKLSAENLFAKADRGVSFQVQRRLLDARGVLQKKSFDVKAQMKKAMEKLLHRSFQTTYSNYRPSFSNSLLDGPISLIDTSAFEDELRFNSITDRFRNEAGEQLRDLNIRIALLFEQDNIRERENPFRPYLFSRAIAMAVENVDAPVDLHTTLTDQLAEDFTAHISSIYAAVNSHLAENGIAAQLMLKPKRSPEARPKPRGDDEEFEDGQGGPDQFGPGAGGGKFGGGTRQHAQSGNDYSGGGAGPAPYQGPTPNYGQAGNQSGQYPAMGENRQVFNSMQSVGPHGQGNATQAATDELQNPVERLFKSVKAFAARPFRNHAAAGEAVNDESAGGDHSGIPSSQVGQGHGAQMPSGAVNGGAGNAQAMSGFANSGNRADGGVQNGPDNAGASHDAHPQSGKVSAGADARTAFGGAQASPNGGIERNGEPDYSGGSADQVQADTQSVHPAGYGEAVAAGARGRHSQSTDAGSYSHHSGGNGGNGGQGSSNADKSALDRVADQMRDDAANASGEEHAGDAHRSRPSWLSGKKAVGEVLRRFFSGKSTQDDFADDIDETSDDTQSLKRPVAGLLTGSVQRMLRHETPSTDEMYGGNGELRNLIMERRDNLNEIAHNVKEQMTIDIVSMLFEFILRDTQVPAEVRAQLGRLQFLVLKIALRDESLLTTKAHPARMLVNRIGSISLGLKQIDPSGANVTAEICRIVEAILADETENPGLFLKMLDDLDTFIARELLVSDKNVTQAVEVVEHAESRTLRLAHTCAQMSEALLGLTINEHLKDFLENDWARAIEFAERNSPEIASEYRALVPDLLWSVLPKVTEEDRQQLLSLLPPILKTIHGGMEPVGWPAANKQTLMDWLFDTHTLVLRGTNSSTAPTSFSSIHTHFRKFIENPEHSTQAPAPAVSPANRKGYLEEAMRELDVRINLLDHFFDGDADLDDEGLPTTPTSEAEAMEHAIDITERLRIGVAIEVNLGGKPSAGRLNWINPNASNLVLTLNDQAEPSMLSVRMFQRLLNNDRVRFLEAEPIFERAVESLLMSANQIG
ncbi:MAG TPA: DUF1631 family protein [Burkholderiaceae bacterium]